MKRFQEVKKATGNFIEKGRDSKTLNTSSLISNRFFRVGTLGKKETHCYYSKELEFIAFSRHRKPSSFARARIQYSSCTPFSHPLKIFFSRHRFWLAGGRLDVYVKV